ncbi:MAG: Ig-like domain repeat protein [Terracidiphilus sp.]
MTSAGSLRLFLALTIAFPAIAGNAQHTEPATQPAGRPAAGPSKAAVQYGKLPLSFEPNLGQTAKEVQWLARGPEYTLFLAGHDAVLELNKTVPAKRGATRPEELTPSISSSVVRMNLLGARTAQQTTGEEPLPGKANYFTGNDASKWQLSVPMYGKVRLQRVYPGIDLVYYGRQGRLEYDFVVAPGADASAIRMNFDGAKVDLAANGDLVLPVSGGPAIRFNKPVVYQMKDGARRPVDGSFAIAENRQVRFKLGAYDRSHELIVDPTLLFLGTLANGGAGETVAEGMAVDPNGEIILTGLTQDAAFPVTTGALQSTCDTDAPVDKGLPYMRCGSSQTSSGFVSKISADGTSLVYSTYLHGLSGNEYGYAVASDASGDAYVLGATSSNDFPVTKNAYQSVCQPYYPTVPGSIAPECDGFFDGGGTEYTVSGPIMFIAELNPSGSALIYSTFFGGTIAVYPEAFALDSSNNMYFAGYLQSALAADNAYPNSGSIPFPVTGGALQSDGVGGVVATLSELSADGQTLMYSTLIGSVSTESYVGTTQPVALTVGSNGMAYLAGQTNSLGFPTTSGVVTPSCPPTDPSNLGYNMCAGWMGFLSAFDTTQSGSDSLVYSTFIGPAVPIPSTAATSVYGVAADSNGNAYVTGSTTTNNYPVTKDAFQTTCPENQNEPKGQGTCESQGFLSKINPSGTGYVWSTYYGGTPLSSSYGNSIAFDARGWVYLYGWDSNYGYDLPFVNPLEPRPQASYAYISTFSPDGTKLIFGTPIGDQGGEYNEYSITNNGMALDAGGNIYFAGYGADNATMVTTPGTYTTTGGGGYNRSFFGKISKLTGPVATTLTISPSPALPGADITFTASVAGTVGNTPQPTGTVTLTNGNTTPATVLGTITLGSNGSGNFSTSSLRRGDYSVTATYSGDANYQTGASTAQTLVVNQFQPTIKVVPASLSIDRTAALSVTVSVNGGSGNPTPTGSVTLSSGSYNSAAATLTGGIVKIDVPANVLNDGTDTLLASYTPNASSSATYRTSTGSAAVKVSKVKQTIEFKAPGRPVVYGVKPIKLTATASSHLAVTFTVLSGHAKISGDELTITGAGTVEVAAKQPGNASYDAATPETRKIVVDKATQKIDFKAPPSKVTYPAKPITLSATSSSHLSVAFSVVSGPAKLHGNTLSITGTGTVVVAANQAGNADYEPAHEVKDSIVVQ